MFRYFRYLMGFALVATALSACADQSEGQRCDPLNGDRDCSSGLVCVKADQLALVDVGAVCCPPAGQNDNPVKECRGDLQADGGSPIRPVTSTPDASSAADAAAAADGAVAAADAAP